MSFMRRFLSGSMAAVLAAGMLTGCSSVKKSDLSGDYSEIVVATYGDEDIYLDEVNFCLRNNQLMYEYYGAIYGFDIWESEGMEDSLREETMAEIYQTRVLCDHAEDYGVELTDEELELVAETVESTLSDEDNQAFLEIAGNDEEMLTDLLTMNALANKVYYAILSETEITTTEEDVRQNAISYLLLMEDPDADEEESEDETEEASEDETEEEDDTTYYVEADAEAALEEIQNGTDIADVGEALDLTVYETNYGVNEEQSSTFGETAVTLSEGESAIAYVEGTGWYVMICDSENDEEATASAYESAVSEEQEAHFEEVYEELSKQKFKVNEDVYNSLDIADTPVYGIETEEEETEETEEETEETEEETDETEGETEEADTSETEEETEEDSSLVEE